MIKRGMDKFVQLVYKNQILNDRPSFFKFLDAIVCFTYIALAYLITITAVKGMLNKSLIASILIVPTIALIYYIVKYKPTFFNNISYGKVWTVLYILSVPIMFIVMFNIECEFSWDWGTIINSASNSILHGDEKPVEYLATYPNNRFWYGFIVVFLKCIKAVIPSADIELFKDCTMCLSAVMVLVTMLLIYLTARLVLTPKRAFAVGVASLLFAPMYLYAMFCYTDTPAMLICSIIIYTYTKFKLLKSNLTKLVCLVTIGILSGIIYHIKIMMLILTIALILDILLSIKKDALKSIISVVALVVSCVITVVGICVILDKAIDIDDKTYDKYEFPLSHWVMMSLNESGGYIPNDVKFTKSFDSYEKKQQATIAEIKNRISKRGVVGTARHIFSTKLSRTWSDSFLGADDYCSRYTIDTNNIFSRLLTKNGDLHWLALVFSEIYYVLMILGLAFAGIFKQKGKQMKTCTNALKLTVIGIALFMMLWECNSRYIFIFTPVIILLSASGWSRFIDAVVKKRIV